MIISRTPYRISFFGGGTDYSSWYRNHGGAVLSTTINRHCYITARWLPSFFEEKSRIIWSHIEAVKDHKDIKHPAVRACLKYLGIDQGIEIHHGGDLPARSGLGSSSAFTVGLLNCLSHLKKQKWPVSRLAQEAISIERDVLRENVGIQDQIACAFGGFNRVDISTHGHTIVDRIVLPAQLANLENHLLLFFTGVSRTASDIALDQINLHKEGRKEAELRWMQQSVDLGLDALRSNDMHGFGSLLHESWLIKRSLTKKIAPQFVDDIYATARKAGAIGGKLLGAGGGGFMLIFAYPDTHDEIRHALKDLLCVPFKFENNGSQIIFQA